MSTLHSPDVPVRTARELRDRWAALLDPPTFGARSLWTTWLHDDGRVLPLVVPVDELPARFDAFAASNLFDVCTAVLTEHLGGTGHVAMALCRPGDADPTDRDQAWADGLERIARRRGLSWSLHLAAGGAVVPLVAPEW